MMAPLQEFVPPNTINQQFGTGTGILQRLETTLYSRQMTPQAGETNDLRLQHLEGEAIERLEELFQPRYDGRLLQLNEQLMIDIKRFCDSDAIKGGFGVVHFTGKQALPGLQSKVALKVITTESDHGCDDEQKQRSVKNEKLAARLLHFGICPVIASWETADRRLSCLLSPYLENGSLLYAIENKNLNLQDTLKILHQIVSAIGYLHTPVKHFKEGEHCREVVLHKDLKTANIVLDKANNARLIDFGLAREMSKGRDKHTITRFGTTGTDGYIPDKESRHFTKYHDYHAFGVVIRELLTGNLPVTWKNGRKVELRTSSDTYVRNRFAEIWKHNDETKIMAELLLQLSTYCMKSIPDTTNASFINQDSTERYIKTEIENILANCKDSRRWTRLEDGKCEMCIVNNAAPKKIPSGHTNECIKNQTQIQICASCMRNAYLNPIRCHSCDGDIKPPVGEDWCAVLIAGNDYRKYVATAFKKGVESLHEVMVSKYPPVMCLSEAEAILVCPKLPGKKQTLKEDIEQAFKQLAKKVHGTVVFLFSGHYLQTKESFQLGLTKDDELITKRDIEQLMGTLKAPGGNPKFLVILECCNSPKFNLPDDIVYVQLSACMSDEKISSLNVKNTSLFTTFMRQALIRFTLDEKCMNAPDGMKVCKSCHIEGDFITVETLMDYISQHIEEFLTQNKMENYPEPVWHGDNMKFKDAIVAFNYDYKVEIGFKLQCHGNIRPDTTYLKPTIYKTMEQMKTALLNQIKEKFGIWNKLDAKAYSDILSIEHDTGPKTEDVEEIHTLPTLMTAWAVKRDLRATPRGVDEISKGKVGFCVRDANAMFRKVTEAIKNDNSCASIQYMENLREVTIKRIGFWESLREKISDKEIKDILTDFEELSIQNTEEVHMIFPKAELTSDVNVASDRDLKPYSQMRTHSLYTNSPKGQVRVRLADESQMSTVVMELVPDFVCFQLHTIMNSVANEASS